MKVEVRNNNVEQALRILKRKTQKEGTIRIARAKEFYEKAISIDENNKTALEYQGEFFAQIGEIEKAKENLEKLLSLCPNSCKEYEMLKDYISGKVKKS